MVTNRMWIMGGLTIALCSVVLAQHGNVFSPDGKILATGYSTGFVELRDVKTWKLIGSVTQRGRSPFHEPNADMVSMSFHPRLAFSPDSRFLATSSGDMPVALWDLKTCKLVKTLPIKSIGYTLSFSPDGKLLAGIGIDGKSGPHRLTVWDVSTGKAGKTWTLPENYGKGHNRDRIVKANFYPKANMILVETVENHLPYLRIWDTRTWKQTHKIKAESWMLSSDCKRMLLGHGGEPRFTYNLAWAVDSNSFNRVAPGQEASVSPAPTTFKSESAMAKWAAGGAGGGEVHKPLIIGGKKVYCLTQSLTTDRPTSIACIYTKKGDGFSLRWYVPQANGTYKFSVEEGQLRITFDPSGTATLEPIVAELSEEALFGK